MYIWLCMYVYIIYIYIIDADRDRVWDRAVQERTTIAQDPSAHRARAAPPLGCHDRSRTRCNESKEARLLLLLPAGQGQGSTRAARKYDYGRDCFKAVAGRQGKGRSDNGPKPSGSRTTKQMLTCTTAVYVYIHICIYIYMYVSFGNSVLDLNASVCIRSHCTHGSCV